MLLVIEGKNFESDVSTKHKALPNLKTITAYKQ
jgi:hypothetical protein